MKQRVKTSHCACVSVRLFHTLFFTLIYLPEQDFVCEMC